MNRNAVFLSEAEVAQIGFAKVGRGPKIHPSCVFVVADKISLGDNVRIDPFCVITAAEPLRIGGNVHIGSHCSIVAAAGVDISDFASVSHGVRLFSESDDLAASALIGAQVPRALRVIKSGQIRLAAHSCIGASAIVLPGVTVGEGAVVGALSLVRADLEPWSVNAGVPSRQVGRRDRSAVLSLSRALINDKSV